MSDLGYTNNLYGMGDNAILKEMANFVKQTRLKKNVTQTYLAEKAGIHRVTLSEFENGERSISLLTLIQLLRALNELETLEIFKVQTSISPLQMAKLESEKRQRASTPRKNAPKKKLAEKKKK
jgi:transcriptional regulator with XRE-family HTH domain